LKNKVFRRNADLQVEVDSFKTHFSKYEAQDFKSKLAQDSFQSQLYQELTLLKEDRELLLWQLEKQMIRSHETSAKEEAQRQKIELIEKAIREFQDKENSYLE